MSDVHREIDAHILAAERSLERGNPDKAEQHLLSVRQLCDANDVPHFGRLSLSAIHARNAVQVKAETDRRLKNREAAK